MTSVTDPEQDEFHIDLTASGPRKSYAWPIGVIVATVTIVFIVITMTTDFAAYVLPMSDDYLQAMVPRAPDGLEPLALKSLSHEILEKTITVRGSIANRTEYPVKDLVVVIELQDTTGRFGRTLEVPIEPAELALQAEGAFQATATLEERPAGYIIKFRFVDDGPFVPHRDARTTTFGITGK